jgi:hypothetical protein
MALWALSDEVAILARPRAAYSSLALRAPRGGTPWTAVRRPLFTALLLGATVSFLATGTLTVRLVLGGALVWGFVPLFEAASLAVVCRGRPAVLSLSRTLDLFFAGRGAWSLALIALGAAAAFSTPLEVDAWSSLDRPNLVVAGVAAAATAWSGYVDLCFFRVVLGYPPARAVRRLAAQRTLAWTASLAYFGGMALPPYVFRLFRT